MRRAGNRFYDVQTGQPYHPANPVFEGIDYTLTASDGTIYFIESDRGIVEQVDATGSRWSISDAGIVATDGQAITFARDALGRITSATAPDGARVVYRYDALGNLAHVRHLRSAQTLRYAYDEDHLLQLVAFPGGGEFISTNGAVHTEPIQDNLGSSYTFTSYPVDQSLPAGEAHRYTFSITASELTSTAANKVLVRATARPTAGSALRLAAPNVTGAQLVSSGTSSNQVTSLFEIDRATLYQLQVAGEDALASGDYQLELTIAGDLNRDAVVDGLDTQLLVGSLGLQRGQVGYKADYDVDGSGTIDQADHLLVAGNFGFVANRPPQLSQNLPDVLTHRDLLVMVELAQLATDPEGDAIAWRVVSAEHGQALIDASGGSVTFVPENGYTGPASFQIAADDGLNGSAAAAIDVAVSDAPLVSLAIINRGLTLEVGQQVPLLITGDFSDQANVALPPSYLNFTSQFPSVATISSQGVVVGLDDGATAVLVGRQDVQAATAVTVGTIEDELPSFASVLGIDVYPDAVALGPGGQRHLLVRVGEEVDLTGSENGTLYVSGNTAIATVSTEGVIEAQDVGQTEVTVLYGANEVIVPVRVAPVNTGPTVVGTQGAIVANSDNYVVAVPPGALAEDTLVQIETVDEVDLPLPPPELFDFVGGFDLEVGDSLLDQPVQIAAPVAGLAAGEEVYFFRHVELPHTAEFPDGVWIMEESGAVGEDGVARTTSPPWPGLTQKGRYLIANANRPSTNITIKLKVLLAKFALEQAIDQMAGMLISSVLGSTPWGIIWRGVQAVDLLSDITDFTKELYSLNWHPTQEEPGPAVQGINVERLPGANTARVVLSKLPNSSPNSDPPRIESVEYTTEDGNPYLLIYGHRFTWPNSPGSQYLTGQPDGTQIQDLDVIFDQGSQRRHA